MLLEGRLQGIGGMGLMELQWTGEQEGLLARLWKVTV